MATVRYLDPDRREALRWLRGQLAWEDTLRGLRDPSSAAPERSDERPAA